MYQVIPSTRVPDELAEEPRVCRMPTVDYRVRGSGNTHHKPFPFHQLDIGGEKKRGTKSPPCVASGKGWPRTPGYLYQGETPPRIRGPARQTAPKIATRASIRVEMLTKLLALTSLIFILERLYIQRASVGRGPRE